MHFITKTHCSGYFGLTRYAQGEFGLSSALRIASKNKIKTWKQKPDLQSQKHMEPLSPPDTRTPSSLQTRELTIALWPGRF